MIRADDVGLRRTWILFAAIWAVFLFAFVWAIIQGDPEWLREARKD